MSIENHIEIFIIVECKMDGIEKGMQWKKIQSRLDVINSNSYFKLIFDDTIKDSHRLA